MIIFCPISMFLASFKISFYSLQHPNCNLILFLTFYRLMGSVYNSLILTSIPSISTSISSSLVCTGSYFVILHCETGNGKEAHF